MRLLTMRATVLALTVSLPHLAAAQAPAPAPQGAAAAAQAPLKAEELEALVSPIALYPDTLLAEVLMAATYPLEVVQADRWATANKSLKGDQLKAAVDKQSWDDSIKALAATPSVLSMMSTKLDWTQKLGDALLAQQADVMDAVQRLRAKAQANNKLASTKEQKVSVTQQQNKQVIVIEPTQRDTIYVPYYDPAVVYGGWPYPTYPPYTFPPPGYIAGGIIATGIAFGAGYAVGRWAAGGFRWGGGLNWGGNNINVNRSVNVNNVNVRNWQHNPEHRHGVRYSNTNVQQRFAKGTAGAERRMDFRGRGGEQVLRPGEGGARDRPGADRPGADRGGRDRPGADRPGADRGGRDRPDADRGARDRPGADRAAASRPVANRPHRDSGFGNINSGKLANLQSARGHESLGGRGLQSGGFQRGGGAAMRGGATRGGGRRR